MEVSETRPSTPVREARLRQKRQLIDVAAQAGISPGYLSMIESGYHPPARTRNAIANVLNRLEASLWPPA
jgi:transcriptional regulator with XRE-family HTH domain